MWTFLRLYQLITLQLLFQIQETKVASMITVSENSTALLSDQNYVRKTKNLIQTFHSKQNFIPNARLKWELLKYEIRKFTFKYSKKNCKRTERK